MVREPQGAAELNELLIRIDSAIARSEVAASHLVNRQQTLRKAAMETLADLDRLIAGKEPVDG